MDWLIGWLVGFALLPAGVKELAAANGQRVKVDSMRKHMTKLFDEALGGLTSAGKRVVYIGEDVRHGG
jgi:hypothetical protein